jgi:hypothetical protein
MRFAVKKKILKKFDFALFGGIILGQPVQLFIKALNLELKKKKIEF